MDIHTEKQVRENSLELILQELSPFLQDGILDVTYNPLYLHTFPDDIVPFLSTIHVFLNLAIKDMLHGKQKEDANPTGFIHVHAYESRLFIAALDSIGQLQELLKGTEDDFFVQESYLNVIESCKQYLHETAGSQIPSEAFSSSSPLFISIPIFIKKTTALIQRPNGKEALVTLKKIGKGSYASVYYYYDDFYEMDVAVKELDPTANEKERDRFLKEYSVLKSLRSPYLVNVYHFEEKPMRYFMEYCDGNIESLVQDAHFSLQNRISIVNQLVRAVDYINEKGILHEDLHPANILYREYDKEYVVKLADFGLVKDINNPLTSSGSDVKGRFQDPDLSIVGFRNFSIKHEMYALIQCIVFILSGKSYASLDKDDPLKDLTQEVITHRIPDLKAFKSKLSTILKSKMNDCNKSMGKPKQGF